VTQFNFAGHDVDTGEQFTLPWVPLESFAIAGVEYIVPPTETKQTQCTTTRPQLAM